uniref:Uncharacterized protein n=1 Tax=Salvator merianae TaxID=96440 RepID=A0A8D0DPN6_SALMN
MTNIGEVIKALNDLGRFQFCLVGLITLSLPTIAFQFFGQLFMVTKEVHYCNTSWFNSIALNLSLEEQLNLTIPRKADGTFEECVMYSPVDQDFDDILLYGLNATEKCQHGWVYPSSQEKFTLISDNKICFSPARFGRRPTILLCIFFQGVFGVAVAFVPDFLLYNVLRFVLGASASGIGIGTLALGKCSSQALPESARWLVSRGRIEEAKKLLQKAASINRRTIPQQLLDQLKPEKEIKSASVLDFFRNRRLGKMTFVMSSIWFISSMVYYGLSLNVGSFGFNIYLTQVVFAVVEIPARIGCIFLMQRFGRKKCQAACLFLGGVVCLGISAIPKDIPTLITVLAVIGKCSSAASLSTSYVYSAELFPTVVRQTGVGVCQMSARLAGIIAPLISLLEKYHTFIPVVIFGSSAVIGGILCCFLPETRGRELQDHVDDMAGNQRQVWRVQPPCLNSHGGTNPFF